MDALKLVIFDVDGTLIDSQHAIVAAMEEAARFAALPPPTRAEVLSIVGLSLPGAVARLYPEASADQQADMVAGYKHAYMTSADRDGSPPLFAGALMAMEELAARDEVFLGTATGMSRRGMTRILDTFGLHDLFATTQTADDHPSKPDPAMVLAAMRATGVEPEHTVFVGDTTYDIEAGVAAKVSTIGVTWGYHDARALADAGAHRVIDDFAALIPTIDELWSTT